MINVRQKFVDVRLSQEKSMGRRVGFFSFGLHTPVTFPDEYPLGVKYLLLRNSPRGGSGKNPEKDPGGYGRKSTQERNFTNPPKFFQSKDTFLANFSYPSPVFKDLLSWRACRPHKLLTEYSKTSAGSSEKNSSF